MFYGNIYGAVKVLVLYMAKALHILDWPRFNMSNIWFKYPVYSHKDTSSAMAASLLTVRKFRRVYMRIIRVVFLRCPKISGKLMNNSLWIKKNVTLSNP